MSQRYRDEMEQFEKDGYVLVPNLLVAEEVQILTDAAHADDKMLGSAFELADTGGARIRLSGWNHAGDDTLASSPACPALLIEWRPSLVGRSITITPK